MTFFLVWKTNDNFFSILLWCILTFNVIFRWFLRIPVKVLGLFSIHNLLLIPVIACQIGWINLLIRILIFHIHNLQGWSWPVSPFILFSLHFFTVRCDLSVTLAAWKGQLRHHYGDHSTGRRRSHSTCQCQSEHQRCSWLSSAPSVWASAVLLHRIWGRAPGNRGWRSESQRQEWLVSAFSMFHLK